MFQICCSACPEDEPVPVEMEDVMTSGSPIKDMKGSEEAGNPDGKIEAGEPEMKVEATPSMPIKRDPKHIISIVFKTQPLGINFTSSVDGTSAYVTKVVEESNEAIKDSKLPLDSKVLTINGTDVELSEFDDIIKLLVNGLNTLPLELTFCHPDGLDQNEVPDRSE